MIAFDVLFGYIASVFLLIATPGPVIMLIIRNASLYGFKNALFTGIGTNAASLILIAISIAIILGLFSITESLLSIISAFGCLFIFYLGASSFISNIKSGALKHLGKNNDIEQNLDSKDSSDSLANDNSTVMLSGSETSFKQNLDSSPKAQNDKNLQNKDSKNNTDSTQSKQLSLKHAFLQGFSIAITNPKDFLFFLAFFPQFLSISNSLTLSFTLLVILWIALDFSIIITYSLLLQKMIFLRYKHILAIISDYTLMIVGIAGLVYIILEFS